MNGQQWFYESNGQPAGPIGWDALMVGVRQGTVTPETRVWSSHLSEWTLLGEIMRVPRVPAPLAPPPEFRPGERHDAPSPIPSELPLPRKSKSGIWAWIGGCVAILLPLGILAGVITGFQQGPASRSSPENAGEALGRGSRQSSPPAASQANSEKIQLEQEILRCAQQIDLLGAEINSMARADNAYDIRNYIRRDVALREQALLKLRDLLQQYELRYGRPALLVFARQNGLQNAIGM